MEEQYFLDGAAAFTAEAVWTWLLQLPLFLHLLMFAALLAVIGAVLVVRNNDAARQRLEEDYRRRALERDQKLRQEVYLPAAEAISRAQEFLSKYPSLDLSRDGAQVLVDYVVGALGRVHLVGSEDTVRATLALSTEFTNAHLNLSTRRRPLLELQNEVESLDAKARQLSYERDQLLASITRMAGDGLEQHGAIWGEMNLRFDKLHREISTLLSQRGERLGKKTRLQYEIGLEAARHALKLARLAVPAYLALRRELDIPIDENEYRQLTQRSIGEIERLIRELADKDSGGESRPAPKAAANGGTAAPVGGEEKPHEARLRMVLKRS